MQPNSTLFTRGGEAAKWLVCAALMALVFSASARGGYGYGKQGMKNLKYMLEYSIKAADSDGDGVLSLEEYGRAPLEMFATIDSNSDQRLTLTEFVAARELRRQQRLLRRMDSDGDGAVTADEFGGNRWMGRGYKKGMRGKGMRGMGMGCLGMGGMGGMGMGCPGMGMGGMGMGGMGMGGMGMGCIGMGTPADCEQRQKEIFALADRDGNGKLGLDELGDIRQVRLEYHFRRLDSDGSESLTPEEYRAPVEANFAALDLNGDGSLDRREIAEAVSMRRNFKGKKSKRGRKGRRGYWGGAYRD